MQFLSRYWESEWIQDELVANKLYRLKQVHPVAWIKTSNLVSEFGILFFLLLLISVLCDWAHVSGVGGSPFWYSCLLAVGNHPCDLLLFAKGQQKFALNWGHDHQELEEVFHFWGWTRFIVESLFVMISLFLVIFSGCLKWFFFQDGCISQTLWRDDDHGGFKKALQASSSQDIAVSLTQHHPARSCRIAVSDDKVTVLDDKEVRRRFRASNYQSTTRRDRWFRRWSDGSVNFNGFQRNALSTTECGWKLAGNEFFELPRRCCCIVFWILKSVKGECLVRKPHDIFQPSGSINNP